MERTPLVNFRDDNDPKTIIVKGSTGDPLRINFADFNADKHEVHELSHRGADGNEYTGPVAKTDDTAKGGRGGRGGKGKGADDQAYTIEDGGKFYRTDKDGNRLNPDPFDTAELAAAAPITIS